MPRATSRATLFEVAAQADVSVSTVSKVLNGRAGVSDETRARIEALLQDHRYQQRSGKRQAAPLLDVLCYEVDSPFGSEVLASIEQSARLQRIGMVLSGATEQATPYAHWVDDVLRRQPVGVVLIACKLSADDRQRLRSRNIPLVMVDPAGTPAPDVPSIGSADWNGGYQATRHLIDLGHTRIGIITGPADMMASTARLSGYRAALDSAGLTGEPELVRPGRFHHADGLEQGRALLSLPDPPTAIFASSDLYALGVYEAARTLGLSIPADLSVVGYDDLSIARWAGPPLTTVHVPLVAMAEQAVHLVMRLNDEPEMAFSRIDIDTTLVVRGSTAARNISK
ncbi:LacI family DNA-binding transcriptional regulator [Paractinoplanes toevensis]|uniref:Transcriptional regulator n=1 Tax=Paractinoplanes toevensis TaxID=571911 RepID=A0A919T7R9_9ACTN|nr:LacI family DNA-binding transcriptional regulator [Actinoplanes toevensis]GIM90570.1 transcriptional regulator [Actinoplanes toevensis]